MEKLLPLPIRRVSETVVMSPTLSRIRNGSALLVCFFAPWWWRPGWILPAPFPYFFGFLLVIPWAVAMITWALTGFGGMAAWKAVRLWLIPWLLLMGWVLVSLAWALYPDPASDATAQLLAILVFAVLMATAGPQPKSVAIALGAGAVLQAIIALAQAAVQGPIGLGWLGEFGLGPTVSVLRANGLLWLRPYGLTIHPNVLGGALAVGLLALIALLWSTNDRRMRLALAIGSVITFWALLLSFSRSAWIGAAVGFVALIIWGWTHSRSRLSGRLIGGTLAGLAALSILFIALYPAFVFARTGFGDETFEQRSVSDRELFIEYTLRMIRTDPIYGLGVGMNAWQSAQFIRDDPRQIDMQAQSVHDIPLLIWSELGLVGLILWLASQIGAVWLILRVPNPDPVVLGLTVGALALMVVGLVDYYPWGLFQGGLLWVAALGAALRASVITQPKESMTVAIE